MPASGTARPTASPRAAARPDTHAGEAARADGHGNERRARDGRRAASASTASIAGNRRAAWSRPPSLRLARRTPSRTTATPRPLTAQSKARTRPLALGGWAFLVHEARSCCNRPARLRRRCDARLCDGGQSNGAAGLPECRMLAASRGRRQARRGDRTGPAARPQAAHLRRPAPGGGAMGAVERPAGSRVPRRSAPRLAAFARRGRRPHPARRRSRARHGHGVRRLHPAVASRPHRRLGRGAAQPPAADGPDDQRRLGLLSQRMVALSAVRRSGAIRWSAMPTCRGR